MTHPGQPADPAAVEDLLARFPDPRGNLIGILHAVQERFHYLPAAALEQIARRTGFSLQRLYSLATFYTYFSLTPRGRHVVRVCLGTACHVQGAGRVLAELEQQLGCREGETSPDLQFTLESVRCVGACSMAPVVVIDEDTHGGVHPKKVKHLLTRYRRAGEAP